MTHTEHGPAAEPSSAAGTPPPPPADPGADHRPEPAPEACAADAGHEVPAQSHHRRHEVEEAVVERLARIEALLGGGAAAGAAGALSAGTAGGAQLPAWRRATQAETRWASTLAVLAVVLVQFLWLPGRLAVHPRGLMPAVELALLLALIARNPHRIVHGSGAVRLLELTLSLVIGGANAYAAVRLVAGLVRGTDHSSAGTLLLTGGAIWLINIVIFAMLYWELDRGGPAARAQGERDVPDFLFVQMQTPELAPPHWEPVFLDYFYLSFTNSTAFSPTDVMPVTRGAKLLMLAQSAVSLMTVVLVVAKAVNALG